jgi:hypothetical protein
MTIESATGRVLGALEAAGVPHMLVGGLTANFYGIPTATLRPKDLDDARDVLAVQGDILDMAYVEAWCDRHGTSERLRAALAQIPPL